MISTRILLDAYRKGYFPMSVAGTIEWYSPEQRGVVPLDEFRIPKRLQRALKKSSYKTKYFSKTNLKIFCSEVVFLDFYIIGLNDQ